MNTQRAQHIEWAVHYKQKSECYSPIRSARCVLFDIRPAGGRLLGCTKVCGTH